MSSRIPSLYVADSPGRGRGVFTGEPIAPGDVIEICPVIVLPPDDLEKVHATRLHDYYFLWGEAHDRPAFALGFGSLYNHSPEPNAEYELDFDEEVITVYCIRPIAPGEEITFHYQPDADYTEGLWFEPK